MRLKASPALKGLTNVLNGMNITELNQLLPRLGVIIETCFSCARIPLEYIPVLLNVHQLIKDYLKLNVSVQPHKPYLTSLNHNGRQGRPKYMISEQQMQFYVGEYVIVFFIHI